MSSFLFCNEKPRKVCLALAFLRPHSLTVRAAMASPGAGRMWGTHFCGNTSPRRRRSLSTTCCWGIVGSREGRGMRSRSVMHVSPAYMSSEIRIYNSAVALRVSDAFSPPLSISLFLSPFINSLIETNGRTDGGCGRDLRGVGRSRPLTSLPPFSSPLPPKSGLRSQREEIFTRCGRSLFWAEPQFVHACKSIDVTGS